MAVNPSLRLSNLPARPPTPPRCSSRPTQSITASQLDIDETLDVAVEFLDKSFEVDHLISSELRKNRFPVDTPPRSPSITSETTGTSSKRKHKVVFAPFTSWDYHKSPNYTTVQSGQTPVKPLPPSRENGSVKSILKSTKQPLAEGSRKSFSPRKQNNLSVHHFSTFPEMLEAIIQQLAGDTEDRSAKIDAYVTLCRTLQAYKEVPDIDALKSKISLLLQFIRRDISPHNVVNKGPNAAIITAALNLYACLLSIPAIAEIVDDQSYTSFIDLSISTLQDDNVSKTIAQHYLSALMAQKFTIKTLKQDRFGRLLHSVNGLQNRIKGNKIPEYQLELYRRLFKQVPDLMALSVSKWLDVLLPCLLSNVDEIRTRAINVCLFASVQLAGKSEVSDFISQTFETDSNGQTYGQFFVEHLHKMLSDSSTAPSVPRIWSVVSLLCRANFLRSWIQQNLKLWMIVIQTCLRCGPKTKIAARVAWSRYILCVNPSLSTDSSTRMRLRAPVDNYFVDKGAPEVSTESARSGLSMYYALLYYSLRPNAPLEQIDRYWEEYVSEVLQRLACKSKDHATLAHQILTSLFESTASWREMRAVEDTMFTIEELPRLDPKWVRSRISRILDLIQVLIQRVTESNSIADFDPSPMEKMWTAFINSIADAGSKEIILSKDMKAAVANLTNFFYSQHLPQRLLAPLFGRLIENAVGGLGASAFADSFLSIVGSKLEAVLSPTRRPAETVCAVPYLLAGFYSLPHDSTDDVELCSVSATKILRLCCQSRKLRVQKLELLLKCAHAANRSWDDETLDDPQLSSAAIGPLLECAHEFFSSGSLVPGTVNSQTGRDYERALQLIQKCLPHMTIKHLEELETFYNVLVETAKAEAGEAGILLAVTEEHAAFVTNCLRETLGQDKNLKAGFLLSYASIILKHDVRPKRARGELQKARVALWGEGARFVRDKRAEDLDPYKRIYDLINRGLELVYRKMQEVEQGMAVGFLDAVHRYIEQTPASFQSIVLRKVQSGIAVLVQDESHILKFSPMIRAKVKKLWDLVLTIICDLNEYTSNVLSTFETIIVAGLSSSRKSIINGMVNAWNSSFGKAENLDYTANVEQSLRRLHPFVNLELPNWKELADETVPEPSLSLDESSEDTGSDQDLPRFPRQLSRSPAPPRIQVSLSPAPVQINTRKRRTSSPSRSAPRLIPRHDDSQIDFAPIESSPVPEEYNSQLLTDRQKEVAERQRQDTNALFSDIRSSPLYKRLQHDEDMYNPVLRDEPVQERPSTPVFAAVVDAVEGELPKSSSPPRSSPIVAAISRRSTPRKPLEAVRAQEEEDDVPSSPPLQVADELEDETQPFDMFENAEIRESGMTGLDDMQQRSDLFDPEAVDETHVDATINPTRLTVDVEVSHDDLVEQARQRFEAGSSFSTGTDVITGTDDNQEDETQPVLIPATDSTSRKNGGLLQAATAMNEALESSFAVIPATNVEDTDSNMQQIHVAVQSSIPLDHATTSDAVKRKADSSPLNMSRIKRIRRHSTLSEAEASTSPVHEPNRPETPDFDKLEDAHLHSILEVFNNQPDASFDEIALTPRQISREHYTESGQSKRFKVQEARDAWTKMNNEQRAKALRDREGAATRLTQERVVKKRRRPQRRKAQSQEPLVAADQHDLNSGAIPTESDMLDMIVVATPQRAHPDSKVPNVGRRKLSRLSVVSDNTNTTPALSRNNLPPGGQRRTKRRLSQSIVTQEKIVSGKPRSDIVPATEPHQTKKLKTKAYDGPLQHVEIPPSGVSRRKATVVRLTSRNQPSPSTSSFASNQGQPPRAAFPKDDREANVGINAMTVDKDEGFFSIRPFNMPAPSVPGTDNEEASSPTLSSTIFERLNSFSEKWKTIFEDCKRIIDRLSNQERKQGEEGQEKVNEKK